MRHDICMSQRLVAQNLVLHMCIRAYANAYSTHMHIHNSRSNCSVPASVTYTYKTHA